MGSSHYGSHIRKDTTRTGTVDIVGFDSIGSINKVTATTLNALSYVKVGTKYILTSTYKTTASINAAATLLLGTVPKGSIVLGPGEFWIFSADNAATAFAQP
jgi:hypothetical protein